MLKKTNPMERSVYETFFRDGGPVPRVYAFCEADGDTWMLMEFVHGESMSRCTRERLVTHLDHIIRRVFAQISAQRLLFLRGHTVAGAQIIFTDAVLTYMLVHFTQCSRILGSDHDAARIAVDAVAQGWGKALLLLGDVLALFPQVTLYTVYQCVRCVVVVLVDDHSHRLVAQQDVLVLVNDAEINLYTLILSI